MYEVGFREMAALGRVVATRRLVRYQGGEGGYTSGFETALCRKAGVRHALTVNSGTSALISAMVGLGIGPGDEVIVPAYTWIATAIAPLAVGAVPIIADIDESLTLDPEDVERKITEHTRAIIPVHMQNLVCDMERLSEIARRLGLYLIEDACQAVGVRYRGRWAGTIGHAGAFSFNKFKNITAGEGGALLTDDDRVFTRARMYHDAGSWTRGHDDCTNEAVFAGMNFRVSELTGAMLHEQLKRLEGIIARLRRRRAMIVGILASDGFTLSPHHDPDDAVGLSILFESAARASAFAARHKMARHLAASDRHVYTNWEPIMQKRSFDARMNPFDWARREIEYSPDMCTRTLDILDRSCAIDIPYRIPSAVLRRRALAMAR